MVKFGKAMLKKERNHDEGIIFGSWGQYKHQAQQTWLAVALIRIYTLAVKR